MPLSEFLTPINIIFCIFGAIIGTIVGILPGIGTTVAAMMLLPLMYTTFTPEHSIILLTALTYGAQYAGSSSAILFNIPGESSSAVTVVDGYPLHEQGKTYTAIFVATISSFIGGMISFGAILLITPTLINVTMKLTTIHYLIILSISAIMLLSFSNGKKNLVSFALGAFLGLVGSISNTDRLTLNINTLNDGISISVLLLCLFAISEIVSVIMGKKELVDFNRDSSVVNEKIDFSDIKKSLMPSVRGGLLGLLATFPGFSYSFLPLLSYKLEKIISKDKDKFGKGCIEGIAGPESTNNSAAQCIFLPLLMLGVPTGGITAIIISVLSSKGLDVGPKMFITNPEMFGTIIWSLLIVNILLLIMNLNFVKLTIKILSVNKALLSFVIMLLCSSSLMNLSLTYYDLMVASVLIVFGFYVRNVSYNPTYIIMGFVVCPIIEENLIRTLSLI